MTLSGLSLSAAPATALRPDTRVAGDVPDLGRLENRVSTDVLDFQDRRRAQREDDVAGRLAPALNDLDARLDLNWAETRGMLQGATGVGLMTATLDGAGLGPVDLSLPGGTLDAISATSLATATLQAFGRDLPPEAEVRIANRPDGGMSLTITSPRLDTPGTDQGLSGRFEERFDITKQGDKAKATRTDLTGEIDLRATLRR